MTKNYNFLPPNDVDLSIVGESMTPDIIEVCERQRTLSPRRLRARSAERLTPRMIGKHSTTE